MYKLSILNKLIAYSLLLAFALRPIYYVGHVLYYELNIDYIIETYCINTDKPELQCNGKCHLAKQLQLLDEQTDEEHTVMNAIFETFYPLYFQKSTLKIQSRSYPSFTSHQWHYEDMVKLQLAYDSFHPPEYV